MGFGMLLGGLGRAGDALADSAAQNQKFSDERALLEERSRLEEQKTLRIDEAKRVAVRAADLRQGQEITSAARSAANERDASAINTANGSNMSASDADIFRDKPEARKAYGLLESTRKTDLEDRANAAERLGYLDAAKETRAQIQTEVANKRNEDNDKSTNRRLDKQEADSAFLQKIQLRREDRRDNLAEATLEYQKVRGGKEDARAEQAALNGQREATKIALKSASDDIKALEKEKETATPAQIALYDQQIATLRSETARHRRALASAGLDGSEAPPRKGGFDPSKYEPQNPKPGAGDPAAPAKPKAEPAPQAKPKAEIPEVPFAERQAAMLKKYDEIDADKDLQALMREKKTALSNGNPTQANNAIDKYNKLRKERYGI